MKALQIEIRNESEPLFYDTIVDGGLHIYTDIPMDDEINAVIASKNKGTDGISIFGNTPPDGIFTFMKIKTFEEGSYHNYKVIINQDIPYRATMQTFTSVPPTNNSGV